ncbi:hypothetical protein Nepgr_012431 [Nepenthes gracilis]|uniref:Uncharacterized protein n=1 Tax=Nepenthes gracilis TaxID=150966 RepID=A0AAD3XNC4_NEPGR|nr:hypothetical protein Nepgr_012431 [Nepenthes gracilis]
MERLNFARVCVEVARGAHLPAKIRLNSGADVAASPIEIEVAYHGKPGASVKGRDANMVFSFDGDSCVSIEGYQLATSLKPSSLYLADGDGQEKGDVDQVLPAAELLCDSHPLAITLKSAIEVCELVSSPGVVAAAASRESPELLVAFHLPDSKAASYLKESLHLEGQHLPNCAVEVLDDVSSGMPSEAMVEDAPTVVSTPSPHVVQRDLAPDVDSACRIASDVERLQKQLMEIKDQRFLDLHLPCCTQAVCESVPNGSSSRCEATVQGGSLRGANASPSYPQGPPARWTDDELFAKQAINGRYPKAHR